MLLARAVLIPDTSRSRDSLPATCTVKLMTGRLSNKQCERSFNRTACLKDTQHNLEMVLAYSVNKPEYEMKRFPQNLPLLAVQFI